ncbi:uncharacterized protein LY89DRAFT_666975 [Mollisia scopiformis]|uniref:Uncharacterized protein n=1 Tax=Mollisia scopiformis TaxID=149040 RepID=A0A194XIU4_MOLSC|nr:uncharacterized protein LY89DRAFT_666975 [Mollisia scopiformis]KUJ20155.1 hypothetical protein LY89DRAFT_666975 [Mollisia scopiformis]
MRTSILYTIAGLLAAATALPTAPTASSTAQPNLSAIKSVKNSTFHTYKQGGLVRAPLISGGLKTRSSLAARTSCATSSQFTWGDNDHGGPGLVITNGGNAWDGYYMYENSCDSVPFKYFWLAPGSTQFISLPAGFQGRVSRGTDAMNLAGQPQLLGTWLELSFDPYNVNELWGDISLIRGCDGGMLMWALDGSGSWKGFTQDVLANAPVGAWAEKPDGTWVLAPGEGPTTDAETTQYLLGAVGADNAFLNDAYGDPVISSQNRRYGVWMDGGRI